jgi:D-lactate dehydrogenase (cytochrome)
VTTDVCVPISRLADCITETIRDTAASPLSAPILGHVGDGNFHCAILVDPSNVAELDEAERLNRRIVARALAMDGTCTGEHGVGMHKIDFLREEHGDDALELMARIKRSFDPQNILNPGKVVRV